MLSWITLNLNFRICLVFSAVLKRMEEKEIVIFFFFCNHHRSLSGFREPPSLLQMAANKCPLYAAMLMSFPGLCAQPVSIFRSRPSRSQPLISAAWTDHISQMRWDLYKGHKDLLIGSIWDLGTVIILYNMLQNSCRAAVLCNLNSWKQNITRFHLTNIKSRPFKSWPFNFSYY